jgi:hypothetical protein
MSKTEPPSKSELLQDLFLSLQRSIRRLRQEAEDLHQSLSISGEEALSTALPRMTRLEGLIRDCQKVEKTLVEHTPQDDKKQLGLDLAAARAEISRRLDCLRSARTAEISDSEPE